MNDDPTPEAVTEEPFAGVATPTDDLPLLKLKRGEVRRSTKGAPSMEQAVPSQGVPHRELKGAQRAVPGVELVEKLPARKRRRINRKK